MTARPAPATRLFTRLAVTIVVALGAMRSLAQEPAFNLRVDAPLVTVEARVFDAFGKPVTSLTQDDFEIDEDGQAQRIQSFASADSTCNILILLTGTPRAAYLGRQTMMEVLLSTATDFLTVLRAQDRFAVAAYSAQTPSIKVPWQRIHPGMQATFRFPLETGGQLDTLFGYNFYGALGWAAQQFQGIQGRRAVVVFSSGLDRDATPAFLANHSLNTLLIDPLFGLPDSVEESDFQTTVQSMSRSGIPFYFVALRPAFIENLATKTKFGDAGDDSILFQLYEYSGNWKRSEELLSRVHARLEQAANATGGRVYYPQTKEEIQPQAEQIGKELRTFYSLAYRPPNPGSGASHRIAVRVRDKSFQVIQSREEYTAR